MSIAERLFPKEKCLKLAKKAHEEIKRLGSASRIVRSEGNGYIDWDLVFSQSLLGERLHNPSERVIEESLTRKERELLGRMRAGEEVNLVIWADFDGVFVSPAVNWRGSGKIDLITSLGLKEMIQTADRVLFRTSRWLVSDDSLVKRWPFKMFPEPLAGQLTVFPLFDETTVAILQKMAPDKIEVRHKPLFGEDDSLRREAVELMHSGNLDRMMIYSLISSEKDRREAEGLLREFPTVAESLVFFDTAHYYL